MAQTYPPVDAYMKLAKERSSTDATYVASKGSRISYPHALEQNVAPYNKVPETHVKGG